MDYEKAYKESFEVAKSLHEAGDVITKKQMERLFPQLVESDDEWNWRQVRRAIRGFFTNPIDRNELLAWLEKQREQKEQKLILEVFGFKVGDAVRLKDGDGRKHIIKSFEEVEGLHGPNFYHVEFEDNSARSGIYPGEEYPNGYYTQMEKFEEEQKPVEPSDDELQRHQDELYDFKVFAAKQAKEYHISFVHDFEWNNFCDELLSYFNEKQKPAEWSEEDDETLKDIIAGLEATKQLTYRHEPSGRACYNRWIAWLKSLRPSWKPSEKQIKALLHAVNKARTLYFTSLDGCPEYNDLRSLYEQLNELK